MDTDAHRWDEGIGRWRVIAMAVVLGAIMMGFAARTVRAREQRRLDEVAAAKKVLERSCADLYVGATPITLEFVDRHLVYCVVNK